MISSTKSNPLSHLLEYIEKEGWEGYDPYDALNSPVLLALKNKWLRVAATVFFRLSPVNLRKMFRIKKGINPKAAGLLLSAFSILERSGLIQTQGTADMLFSWLRQNASPGYSGYCWGYNFPWQDRNRLLEKGIPTIVNTSFIGHGILDHYDVTKNEVALETARSACDFIRNDLNIHSTERGICFSYNPMEKNIVHNANVLGASLLARVYSYTQEAELLELAEKSFAFTLPFQQEGGLWAYSQNPVSGTERFQTDWHQGFILDSLIWYIEAVNPADEKYWEALKAGAEFYRTQFTDKGACLWRSPRKWPADIHNQAQGIITFSKLEKFHPGSIDMADKITRWTIDNLRDRKKGFFYYEKWPLFTNRIPYFRWGQAWMLLALATFFARSHTASS